MYHLFSKCSFFANTHAPTYSLRSGFFASCSMNLTWTSKETSTAVSVIGHHKGISSALEAHEDMVAKWWVSVSFAVHPDFKILSRASFSLSKSAQCSKSKKKVQYRYNRSLILFEHDERRSGRNSTRHINVR